MLSPLERPRGFGMMNSEGFASPECMTPGLGQKNVSEQRSQGSEMQSHQILWQGLEAHLYKAYFE